MYDLDAFGYVVLAGLLSAVLGAEREWAEKPAGLRTHVMVGTASALLVVLSKQLVSSFQATGGTTDLQADPLRVIQAIVIGIGFLGAGTIVHPGRDRVEGLTTASSVFLTAAIGITVAVERIWLAVEVTLLAVIVLLLMRWAEGRIARIRRSQGGNSGNEDSSETKSGPTGPRQETGGP